MSEGREAAPRRTAPRAADLAGLSAIALLFVALHVDLDGFWFSGDDLCVVAAVARGGILAHFTDPELWRALSSSFVMPWLTASIGADLAFFGLQPTAFATHQLLSSFALLVALYAALRSFADPFAATTATALATASLPVHATATLVTARHYVEGALLCVAAALAYAHGVRSGRRALPWLGALAYALATTAKEVFLPLPALLPFLPVGTARARWRALAPFAAVAMAAALYRVYLLGPHNLLDSYLVGTPPAPPPDRLVRILAALAAAAGGAVALRFARRRRDALAACAVALLVLALPLLAVDGSLGAHHGLLPVLAAAAVVAGGLDGLATGGARRRVVAWSLAALAVALAATALSRQAREEERRTQLARLHAIDGFLLGATRDEVLVLPPGDPFHAGCVLALREALTRDGAGPGFCGDACACPDALATRPSVRVEAGALVAARPATPICDRTRPLSVEMRYDARTRRLAYRLGPYAEGTWWLTLVREPLDAADPPAVAAPVAVPASGEIPFQHPPGRPLAFEIEHRGRDATERTRSPRFLVPRGDTPVEWRRGDGSTDP